MQIIFYTDCDAVEFSVKNNGIFPPSPERCPFKDCSMPIKLERHGYYKRFFISKDFTGILYIRRLIELGIGLASNKIDYKILLDWIIKHS